MSDDFERGVRFAMERRECYAKGKASHDVLQFGDYVFSRPQRDAKLLDASSEHLEKRVQATLLCAKLDQ